MENKHKLRSAGLWFLGGVAFTSVMLHIVGFTNEDKTGNDQYQNYVSDNYKVFSMPVPEAMDFAGEEVPVKRMDVRESMDRELLVNTYWHSNTFLMLKRANRWFPVIEPILAEQGVPEDFKYLALIESGLTNAVSPAGAAGFWQFLKTTGQSYGLEVTDEVDERYHVEKATYAACKYLKDAYNKYGSWSLVAASYNMGMGGVSKQLERQQTDNYWDLLLNDETARYVYRILAVKEIVQRPGDYGFHLRQVDLYEPLNSRSVTVEQSITDLAVWAKEQGVSYKVLKNYNPWLREKSLVVKPGKSYQIQLPA